MKSIMLTSLVVFISVLPKKSQQTFWRQPTTPRPTLPSDSNAPIYKKLQNIPPPKETAQKIVENFFGFQPGKLGKRSLIQEDIVYVMDGSGSVPQCEFNEGVKALTQLMEMCEIPKGSNTYSCRQAAVTFSTGAKVNFAFLSSAQASLAMKGVSYPGGSTNTQAGLAEADKLFLAGSRRFSQLKVLLMTDGHSNVDEHLTIPNAKKLKAMNVQISVIAVGDLDTDAIKEMANVASSPSEKHIFRIEKNHNLVYIFKLALAKLTSGHYTANPYTSPC